MPRIGIPSSKIAGSHWGAPGAYTLAGPPEKIKPRGFISATRAAGKSWRTSWQKTFCSRTRRAMSWPYCAPKSKTRMRSVSGVTFILGICGPRGEHVPEDTASGSGTQECAVQTLVRDDGSGLAHQHQE